VSAIWDVAGREVDAGFLGGFEMLEVLVDIDGPRLFVGRTEDGDDLLAYQVAETDGRFGWIVVPTEARAIEQLRAGELALLDALRQPWSWFVTQSFEGALHGVRRVRFDDLPPASLPSEGVTLVATAQPFLTVRAKGPGLTSRDVPASVVRKVVDGAMHAMKALIEHALEMSPPEGRPSDRLRRYYDLPTRRLAFGSFEAVFGEPVAPNEQPLLDAERLALDRAGVLLRRGIAALQHEVIDGDGAAVDAELGVALDALSGLLPPASGVVEEMQIGGRLVGPSSVRLSREHGVRARKYLRRMRPAVEALVVQGLVRELDKDAMTFIVRSTDLTQEWPCRFSSALRDDVFTAFAEDTPVAVSGHRRAGKPQVEVLAIEVV
jgi:hypothetical protein